MMDKNNLDLIKWCFVLSYPKSGSSSLSVYLKELGLNYPKHGKETYYFNQNHEKNYLRYFNSINADYYGEVTTCVIFNNECLDKMHDEFPDAKIIILIRDPIKRAISKYNHMVRRYDIRDSFSEIIRNENRLFGSYAHHSMMDDYVVKTGGEYLENCRRILTKFGNDNVFFILTEEMQNNKSDMSARISSFLDVEGKRNIEIKNLNQSRLPFVKIITVAIVKFQLALNKILIKLRSVIPPSKLDNFMFRPIVRTMMKTLSSIEEATYSSRKQTLDVSAEDLRFLEDYYNLKLRGLGKLIGKNLNDYWPWYK